MKAGGYETLGGQLFTNTPEGQFQVTPRRRLRGTQNITVPANSTAGFQTVTNAMQDVIRGEGDGFQFDLIQVIASAAAPGTSITGINATLDELTPAGLLNASGLPIPSQPIFTVAAVGSTVNFSGILTPSPSLLTLDDINALSAGIFAANLPAIIRVDVFGLIANSTAGAINVAIIVDAWIRFVRGLQEG